MTTATAASATFAVSYSGDLQLQLGWQYANTKVTDSSIPNPNLDMAAIGAAVGQLPDPIKTQAQQMLPNLRSMFSKLPDTEFPTNNFYMAVSNYNLFNLGNLFSVGFFDKLGMSIGGGNKIKVDGGDDQDISTRRFGLNFIIGPAAAVRVVDIVKFQLGVGFVGGVEITRRASDDISDGTGTGVVGVGVDFQAKVLPRVVVSPLIGFQYAYRGAGSFEFKGDVGDRLPQNMSQLATLIPDQTIEGRFRAYSYAVYLGASWNFGDR